MLGLEPAGEGSRGIQVAMDTIPEFDVGPLSWVQGEIGVSLTRATDALARFRALPAW